MPPLPAEGFADAASHSLIKSVCDRVRHTNELRTTLQHLKYKAALSSAQFHKAIDKPR